MQIQLHISLHDPISRIQILVEISIQVIKHFLESGLSSVDFLYGRKLNPEIPLMLGIGALDGKKGS